MALTQKDFRILASEVKEIRKYDTRKEAAFAVGRGLAQVNAKFDLQRWYRACDVSQEDAPD